MVRIQARLKRKIRNNNGGSSEENEMEGTATRQHNMYNNENDIV